MGKQQMLIQACEYVQPCQSFHSCLHTQSMGVDVDSDQTLDI